MDCEQVLMQFKHLQNEWRKQGELSLKTRRDYLKRIISLLENNCHDIGSSLNQDYSHRARTETYFLELFPTIKAIKYCLKHLNQWVKPKRRKVSYLFQPAKAYVKPQALGVVGNMSPWNYPIYLALVPAVYALSAGNRVMIKFSELTPKTGELMATLIQEAFPEGDVCLINGDVEVAKYFASLPFGHLIFTGSTTVGRHIMQAASEHLTPITLELGGKSPALVSTTCPDEYFQRLLMGKCCNAGQTCIAPDYLLLPEQQSEKFENIVNEFVNKRYPDMPDDDHYSSIITKSHFHRLMSMIEDAKEKGGKIISMGEPNERQRKIPLTLIFNVSDKMAVMNEEIFGPVLPIVKYDNFDQAVSYIDKHPNPLALYYFGNDKSEIDKVNSRHLSGALTINDTIMHIAIDDLPFGGVGESGLGCYHGKEGFERFSLMKPIFIQRKLSPVTWLYPPYGKLMKYFLTWIGRLKIKDES